MHHAQIALGNQVGNRQAIAAIPHGDFRHKPQMAGYKLMRGVHIAAILPGFGQHIFLFRLQHREGPDLFKITRQIAVRAERGEG